MGKTAGRFDVLAISRLGLAVDDLLTAGHDPKCLSNSDLRCLAEHVLVQATSATAPKLGVHRYQLVTPGAKETRTKNRGG
jgi:hypothetical protein